MKIKTIPMNYEDVLTLSKPKRFSPKRPNLFFRTLVRLAANKDLKETNFTFKTDYRYNGLDEPYLILMNHSSFIDLEIVSKIFFPKPYCIVCTSDGFVGKKWLMRELGCIPTKKFLPDVSLIKDIKYALTRKKTSVLMYPEASYSFDGTCTPLPKKLGRLLKHLDVPVIMIKTHGAFSRDPLYNNLQKRKVNVSADVSVLFTREEVEQLTNEQLDQQISKAFNFDNFSWQKEKHISINETFRADGLERILFKCSSCGVEGKMVGKGIELKCTSCGKTHILDEYGYLKSADNDTRFSHIPDWFSWERIEVRKEIENDTYILDTDVTIGMMVDYKSIYMIGEGHLTHTSNGFNLVGANGKLNYHQNCQSSYSLYSDYYWYEIGDVICIGDKDVLYYCFPKKDGVVAKTRMAQEEIYKLKYENISC